jgi:acyl dehydratase
MALDPAKIGFSYPQTAPYVVGREKIREFAEAIGTSDPVHFDVDAAAALGYADVIAPPTFPIVLTNPAVYVMANDAELGLDYSRVVHGDQRFSYVRPVIAGDVLVCVTTIADISVRVGTGFLTTNTVVTTIDGEPVVTATARLVVRAADDPAEEAK